MSLPQDFLDKMQQLLGEEFDEFIKSYDHEKSHGLRLNLLKTSMESFKEKNKLTLDSIPWVEEGFFYKGEERPGKHPYHEAGVYYIQE